jgi:AcrR family transcriptional regulator
MKSRRETNIAETRVALMRTARRHFAREGYSGAEITRIAAEARVTTGAIYHHFSGKKGLFQAVAEELEAEILKAAAAVGGDDPWHRLQAGFEKLIDACASPDVQRIIFVEAPQVIGSDAWRKIELRYAFGATRAVLAALGDAGITRPYPIDLVARLLLALLRETSSEVARSKNNPAVRAQIAELVAGVFGVLSNPATDARG